jgi:predicted O-linked N-acetylglucosamine transferase (SPINDLY family)
LDSYPAGGCTTTREALELGKAVVTLPAKLLGGRWSLAYYALLGCGELSQQVPRPRRCHAKRGPSSRVG